MTSSTTSPDPQPHGSQQEPDGEEPDGAETWRRDFPYTAAGEEEVTRREFVRYLTLGSAGLAAASVGLAAWTTARRPAVREPKEIVRLDDVAVGEEHLFSYPTDDDPAILLRPSEDEVRAFSQRCTHLACVVVWERADDQLVCPCHHGYFDARNGQVIAGPPERPLDAIELEVRDGVVWAVGGGGH